MDSKSHAKTPFMGPECLLLVYLHKKGGEVGVTTFESEGLMALGTVYRVLGRLTEAGLVEPGRSRIGHNRPYKLTLLGRRVSAHLAAAYDEFLPPA
jgi:DNA-binding PadR family transcriptional regulator